MPEEHEPQDEPQPTPEAEEPKAETPPEPPPVPEDPLERNRQRLQKLLPDLDPEVREALLRPPPPGLRSDPARTLAAEQKMAPEAEAALRRYRAGGDPAPPAPESGPMWYLVECHDGDLPVLRKFPAREGLIERLQILEGMDVGVIAFYGVPARPSVIVGGKRFLLLPNSRAITIDNEAREIDPPTFDPQPGGHLGPPELLGEEPHV